MKIPQLQQETWLQQSKTIMFYKCYPPTKTWGDGGWENDSLTKSYLDQNSEEGTDRVNFMMTILIIPASVEAWRS